MAIVFYASRFSSAIPVACALHELGVPHERVNIDLASGAQRKPEFLALNPNGKVPTLVVDGTPMFEAVAIVQWLGDRYGVQKGLWPAADAPARMTALAWTAWTYVTFGAQLLLLNLASSERAPAETRSAALTEYSKGQLQQLLGLLDARLSAQPYLLGKDYSLADMLTANAVHYGTLCGAGTESHPRVTEWVAKIQARPAVRVEWG